MSSYPASKSAPRCVRSLVQFAACAALVCFLAGGTSVAYGADVSVLARSSDGVYELYATPAADVFWNSTYLGARWSWNWSNDVSFYSGGLTTTIHRSQSLDYIDGTKTSAAPLYGSYRSSLFGTHPHAFVFPVENVQYMNFYSKSVSGGGYWHYEWSFADGAGRLTPRYTDAQDVQQYGQIYAVLDADTGQFVDFFTNKFDSYYEIYGGDLNYLYFIKSQSHLFTPEIPLSGTSPSTYGIVSVVNNPAGTNDTVTVHNLQSGDVVRVYRTASGVTLLGTATAAAGQTTVTIEIPQLGTTAGLLYTTLARVGMFESPRIGYGYLAEAPANTAPVANAGPDRTYEATGPNGAAVTLDGSGSFDRENNPLTWSWSGPFGTATGVKPTVQVPLGGNTITLTVSDGKLSSTDTVVITVVDTTAPTLTLPPNLVLEATSGAGAVASYAASAYDLVSGNVAVHYSIDPGSTFPLGTTTVTVTATDARGNTATGSFTVTVQDTTPPTLSLPADLILEATSPAGAVATYSATATDPVDGAVSVTLTPPSGSTFPLGTTTVTASAADAAGNTTTGTFRVMVVDTTPPTIVGPGNMVIDSTSSAGAQVTYAATASDIVSGSVAVTASIPSGSEFPIGVTTVTLTATDAAGNTATATFTVTVLSPAQQIDALQSLVSGLTELSQNEIATLTTKLNAASTSMAKGNDTSARGQLGSFENQVQAFVNSGRLSSAEGQLLIAKAQNVADQL